MNFENTRQDEIINLTFGVEAIQIKICMKQKFIEYNLKIGLEKFCWLLLFKI